jgi:hypothetical protein
MLLHTGPEAGWRPGRLLPGAVRLAAWMFLLASVLPAPLHAQAGGEKPGRSMAADWQGTLLVGSDGVGEGAHVFGGFETLWLPGRVGVAGAIQAGYGNGYRSTLLGGGLGVRLLDRAALRMHAWAGPAHYAERVDAGVERSLLGVGGGAYLHRLMGRWSLGVHISGFAGSFHGPDFTETASIRSTRTGVGVGYGLGRSR